MAEVPENIKERVEVFARNIDSYKKGSMNETQLRREFIDPFFMELGWDIENKKGYADAYKDVIHEYSLKTKDVREAPDYCFRIGGTRKFFVETKRPSVNVKYDIHPAFQLRSYAWSAKLPLSILTDFEEFAVYDCRIPPHKNDKASTARVLYFTYEDYLKKWEEIEGIFSREAVLKGSFDKYVESNKRKKGTAEVDEVFLDQMEEWRKLIAKNIALRNPSLSIRELNYAVQKTIDRIIFLRICEDRGIEDYGQLMTLQNGVNVYQRLKQVYYRADEKYNSGLFHFEREKDRNEPPDKLTLDISIDDKVLKDIFKNLYYPDSPYEFSVLPADILGQVYEQFLGKVIRLTPAHYAVIDDKPEVKKAGGVYYTPTYIVDYIVQNTLGKILNSPPYKGGVSQSDVVVKKVSKLKILDPACGSGSFLIEAFQYLLDWHLKYYTEDKKKLEKLSSKKNPPVYQGANGVWLLTTAEKKRILLNNIYGVDIDSQAVEVTKLSLLLKVLEGESNETIENQLKFFRERALPDLSNNIKCGNSLIGPDFYDQMEMQFLDDEEKMRINVFDWTEEFKEIMDGGGFDVVIGNPPYGAGFSSAEKDYLSNSFNSYEYQINSFVTFIEKGCSIIKKNGVLSYIVPAVILTQHFYKNIRRLIIENFNLSKSLLLNYKVFIKADTGDTTILVIEKPLRYNIQKFKINFDTLTSADGFNNINYNSFKQIDVLKNNRYEININLSDTILKKIYSQSVMLKNIANCVMGIKPYQKGKGRPKQTTAIVKERPFDSNTKRNKYYKQYIVGKDVNRYVINPLQKRYIKYGEWLAEPRFTAPFERIKIIVRQTSDIIRATLDDKKYYNLNNIYNIEIFNNMYNYYYLLAILNSKLMKYVYQKIVPEKNRVFAEIKKINLNRIPIKMITRDNENGSVKKLISLADYMINLNNKIITLKTPAEKAAIQRQIDAIDKQIDQLVYKLYGLTEDEIKIVEGEK